MKLILTILFFGFTIFIVTAQSELDLLILNRQYSQALSEIEKQLESQQNAALYFQKGLVAEKLMNYDLAIEALWKACAMESQNAVYWEELADAHSELGSYLNAIACLQQALTIDTVNVQLKGKLAQCYINLKAYPDALSYYEQIWSVDSTNTFYNRYYAYAAYRTGKNELAVKLYEMLAAAGSQDLNTWLNLATIYNQQKKMDDALECCDQGLALFPENPSLLLKKADSYFVFKEYENALYAYEAYLATSDSSLEVLKNYGICLYFDQQEEKGLQILDRCYKATVNDPVVNFYIGACYKKLKDFETSAGFLNLAIESATPPYLAEIYHHLGQVYGMLRKFEESIQAYQEALVIDPSKGELYFDIATTYEEFNANKVVALHYYREYIRAVGEGGRNIDYALSRIEKIKEELFFEEGSSGVGE